ncbi:MAG: chemotaxis response regulator protein-glutamate methylesterase [Bacteroidales bacterium]|jgi:two-component system chemotaxis response regulator CheB|nr:chemotaxis response regulator protein-glutamate methylesterase [Bacteroidales bacterium]
MESNKQINVLIVDDSTSMRNMLENFLHHDPYIKVIGKADDPYQAAAFLKNQVPDVITLDIEMPKMDGLTFLKKIMAQHPIPVVIISSLTKKGAIETIKALEYGAIEIILKPFVEEGNQKEGIQLIIDKVRAASMAKVKAKSHTKYEVPPKYTTDAILKKKPLGINVQSNQKIVAIGASTGGTVAIQQILQELPVDSQGIVIVQHMPVNFTKAFAERLNQFCNIHVKEAEDGDIIQNGLALIARGDKHLTLKRQGTNYVVRLLNGPLVNRHKPSVDVLFRSMANHVGANAIGILLTGMGDDGAKGLLEMKETKAITIAQDEKSSTVFGMPREAIKLDAQKFILSLSEITDYIKHLTNYKSK